LYDKWNTKWAQWKKSSYVIDIFIAKKNDEWLTEISGDVFRGGTYTGITCEEVPKEEEVLKEEEVPKEWVKIDGNYKPKNGVEKLIKNDLSLSGSLPAYIINYGSNTEILRYFQGKNFGYGSMESSIKKRYRDLKDWMLVDLKYKNEKGIEVHHVILYIMSNGKWRVGDFGNLALKASKAMLTRTNMWILQRAITSYIASHGQAPEGLDEVSLSYPITTGKLDAWGKEIKYEGLLGDKFRLTSAGGDKQFNTEDDIIMEY